METPFGDSAGRTEARIVDDTTDQLEQPTEVVPEVERLDVNLPEQDTEALDSQVEEEADTEADGGLEAAVERLDARLEESQRLHARQSDLVDRLHTENQGLRAGELRNAQLPLIRDLFRLHDDIGRMRDAVGYSDGDLLIVQENLIDILARSGVEPFAPDPGEPFDSRLHSAVGVEPTSDVSLDKAVVEIVRQGFRWESGDVIRVAEVRAYRYQDSPPDKTSESD